MNNIEIPPTSDETSGGISSKTTNFSEGLVSIMTNSPESNQPDRNKFIDRQFRTLDRRMTRLEATQVTDKELDTSFQQVYDELDEINEKVDRLESKIDIILQQLISRSPEMNYFRELSAKI